MQLARETGDDGVITVYAIASDGRKAAVADFWLRPMVEAFGCEKRAAEEFQEQFADLLCNAHNRLFTVRA